MAGFDGLTLQTEHLQLRPLVTADAPALMEIFSDPRVMRYWSTAPWTGLEQALSTLLRRGAEVSGEREDP